MDKEHLREALRLLQEGAVPNEGPVLSGSGAEPHKEERRPIRLIVAGSRGFNDYTLLETSLIHFLSGRKPSEVEIVSGAARGADTLGERFAYEKHCKLHRMPADWNRLGKQAGYIRNEDMAKYASAPGYDGRCILFWDGKSPGTRHMLDLAYKYHLKVKVIRY